ncbi:MAG: CCA tRNA nucleotidyltransferase [Clostridia bacterium]|nr:CCA tRNA nucleotidyltransferase [Clostridia bacterium]
MLVKLSKESREVIEKLHNKGFLAYAVGGCVRDSLLGKVPYDFDVTTDATPQEVKQLFHKTIDTGIAHGTVTVMINSIPIEVTTFRTDGEYIHNRKPQTVTLVKDVREDLSRRDFTINALCYNDKEGILDLFGGIEDLKNKTIRAVGEPKKRFTEDALRILRAVRFSAQLGFTIEENTKKAIMTCAHLVKNLSVERIAAEFEKILMSDSPEHIKMLYDLGVLEEICPEMCDCFRQNQNTRWHLYDVGTHSLKVIKNCPKLAHLRYAALMHDWGKPHTHGINDLGEDMFRNHAKKSEELSENFCRKYKFSNQLRDKAVRLVKYHDIEILPEKKYVKRAVNKVGDDIFVDLIALKRADCLSQNLELTAERLPYIDRLLELYTEIKENKEPFGVKNLAINGNDLKELGFYGKEIGRVLDLLLEKVIENPKLNEKDKLIEMIKDGL